MYLVSLGRLPFGPFQKNDVQVEEAIVKMKLTAFSDRIATQLSGGEQARVLIRTCFGPRHSNINGG